MAAIDRATTCCEIDRGPVEIGTSAVEIDTTRGEIGADCVEFDADDTEIDGRRAAIEAAAVDRAPTCCMIDRNPSNFE